MKCMRCGRDVFEDTTTEVIELGYGILVVRNVPCYKCDECDEVLFTGEVVQKLEELTERVKQFVQELTVVDYKNAA